MRCNENWMKSTTFYWENIHEKKNFTDRVFFFFFLLISNKDCKPRWKINEKEKLHGPCNPEFIPNTPEPGKQVDIH